MLVSPIVASLGLLLIVVVLTIWDKFRGRFSWAFDFFLYFTVGCVGVVIGFLNFFSVHPAVSPNFLLLVFHPFYFVLIPALLKQRHKLQACWMPKVFAGLVLLATLSFIIFKIQVISVPIVLLASALLIRLLAWAWISDKPQRSRRVQAVGIIR